MHLPHRGVASGCPAVAPARGCLIAMRWMFRRPRTGLISGNNEQKPHACLPTSTEPVHGCSAAKRAWQVLTEGKHSRYFQPPWDAAGERAPATATDATGSDKSRNAGAIRSLPKGPKDRRHGPPSRQGVGKQIRILSLSYPCPILIQSGRDRIGSGWASDGLAPAAGLEGGCWRWNQE